MSVREALFLVLLLVASGLVVWGISMIYIPASLIAAGLLTAGLAVLTLTEVAG